jgi:hypothetical protein
MSAMGGKQTFGGLSLLHAKARSHTPVRLPFLVRHSCPRLVLRNAPGSLELGLAGRVDAGHSRNRGLPFPQGNEAGSSQKEGNCLAGLVRNLSGRNVRKGVESGPKPTDHDPARCLCSELS